MSVMISSPNPIIRFTTTGTSMGAFIQAGDELIVKRLFREQYRLGDVLVYMHPDLEQPVAHRIRWIIKTSRSPWYFCLSGDTNPFLFEWIHEDFIRGRVELIIKKSGQKTELKDILSRSRQHFFKVFVPKFILFLGKKSAIQILHLLQSFRLYRKCLHSLFKKQLQFKSFQRDDLIAIEAKLGSQYAGRGHLIFSDPESPEIANLDVRIRFQGMGIGKNILMLLIDHAKKRNAKRVLLSVWIKSTGAMRLYQSQGFRVIREEELSGIQWRTPRKMLKMELLF